MLGVARYAAMSARACDVKFAYMPMPPRLLLMALWMIDGLFAPASTLLLEGGVLWHMPQLLLAYKTLPFAADAADAGLLTVTVWVTVAAAA